MLFAPDKADVNDQEEGVHHIPAEVLRAQESRGIVSRELIIKLGCPLIFLRNLYVWLSLCNSTCLTLTGIWRCVFQV